MIVDITNELFTELKNSIQTADFHTSYPEVAPSFPCVIVEEIENTDDSESFASNGSNYTNYAIEINIFTKSQTSMSDAKSIRKSIDAILGDKYRMNRDYAKAVPNFQDKSIYRYTMRYSCILDANKTIYRR